MYPNIVPYVRKPVFFNIFLLVILFTVSITPILTRTISPLKYIIIWAIWLLSALIVTKWKYKADAQVSRWWVILLVWEMFLCLIGHSAIGINNFIANIPIFSIPIMMTFVIQNYNKKELQLLERLLLIVMSANILANTYLGIIHPETFTDTYYSYTSEMEGIAALGNIGDSSFVYSCLFSVAAFWITIRAKFSGNSRLFSIIMLIVTVYYLLAINTRGTALFMLLFMAVGFAIFINPHRKRNSSTVILILLFIIILSVVMVPLLELIQNKGSERLGVRVSDVLIVLQGGSIQDADSGSLAARFALAMTSLSTFFSSISNFLVGVGDDMHGGSIFDLMKSGVGGHSEFIDCLARYGIIGAFLYYKVLSSTLRYIRRLSDNQFINSNYFVVYFIFLILSVLNNSFFADMFYVVFMLLPIIKFRFNNKLIANE